MIELQEKIKSLEARLYKPAVKSAEDFYNQADLIKHQSMAKEDMIIAIGYLHNKALSLIDFINKTIKEAECNMKAD